MVGETAGQKRVVAFLGPEATYTHQATLNTFPPSTYTHLPCPTIEDVFTAVQSHAAHHGVVPFENSTNGSVVFTLDLFADRDLRFPDILVCGEAYVGVEHCLLGYLNPRTGVTPTQQGDTAVIAAAAVAMKGGRVEEEQEEDLSHIRTLYSHPQVWTQCAAFLRQHPYLKAAERQDVSSTSRAAQLVAADTTRSSAAISSPVAAAVYKLDVLARGIQDRKDNTTRFFVLGNSQHHSSSSSSSSSFSSSSYSSSLSPSVVPPPPTTTTTSQDPAENSTPKPGDGASDRAQWKSLLSFTVEHTQPGALAHALAVFAQLGINLTSIHARPSGVRNWHYVFFVEVEGRRREAGEEEGAVDKALRELDRVCRGWRWLGSWESRVPV